MINKFPTNSLLDWFNENMRKLPWRENRESYRVWISEIMLQQTQVDVVIPYFLKWMKLFPSIESIAIAPIEKIIKTWEGLGYYSRARNIHTACKILHKQNKTTLPKTKEELLKIKGLGPYTADAILSFAFHKKSTPLDGNVKRVLSRFILYDQPIDTSLSHNYLRSIHLDILPEKKHWIFNEALIELGALICQKKPKCRACPLKEKCLGNIQNKSAIFPIKLNKPKVSIIHRAVAVIVYKDLFLINKVEKGKVMHGLYEFLYVDFIKDQDALHTLNFFCEKKWNLQINLQKTLKSTSHSFTRFRVKLHPFLFSIDRSCEIPSYEWIKKDKVSELPFSSGHRKILTSLMQDF